MIGNPPYQQETATLKENSSNGQTPKKNVFHYFQIAADDISAKGSALVYPAGRWIQKSGKGLKEFGEKQLRDSHLSKVYVFQDSKELFPTAAISDGVSIVIKNMSKETKGFDYFYKKDDEFDEVHIITDGIEELPLNPQHFAIVEKLKKFMSKYNLRCMNDTILPRSLFGIESSFVENNKDKVELYDSSKSVNFDYQIKLLANDKAGKAGRSTWYIINLDDIPQNKSLISKWKVVVSSANAGGQKRDRQLEIIDNHSAFGRSRLALHLFDTKKEAQNFYKYVQSNIIRFAFLMTDEALSTLGKVVPDVEIYNSENKLINFSEDIDKQLALLVGLNEKEIKYIETTLENK